MIRRATAEDAEVIGELWLKLVNYHQALDVDLPRASRDGASRYAQRVNARLDDPHSRIFVAEEDGQVVGYVLGVVVDLVPDMFVQERSGFLADIYVLDEYRNRAIGRALVDALIEWFKSQGLRYFEWHVAVANDAARAFWYSLGGRDSMIRMRYDLFEESDS
ncbi:MAG: GNAT family N-acetyltransferase [Chloroflexi bacterium]|nr:MAG: hypothetical protein CUN54_03580 [Phototrophicales bacterium]RMF80352.1 MAG: GNAT family N-acetyltransferase [Chloroflexota bacterium]